MTARIDLERARREELRWLVLKTLHAGQPIGLSETIILNAIEPCVPDITVTELRREMDYLAERNLIFVLDKRRPIWFAKINRNGIDLVEYTVDCQPGIGRPKEW